MVLAQLAQIEIDDNWANKPIKSLLAVFRSWMPQTSASLCLRITMVNHIFKKFPDIGWKLCIEQFDTRGRIGEYSHKPKWRTDGYGYGEPLQDSTQINTFVDEMVSIALNREAYTTSMLTDLIDRFDGLSAQDQKTIWSIIDKWAREQATDSEKALLREKVRLSVLSTRSLKNPSLSDKQEKSAKSAYEALEPSNLLNKHSWLFKERWVQPSTDEIDDVDSYDYDKRDEKIKCLRIEALGEILNEMGNDGLLSLAQKGNTAWDIGWLCAKYLMEKETLLELLRLAFTKVLGEHKGKSHFSSLISGALLVDSQSTQSHSILNELSIGLQDYEHVTLLLLAPFRRATWSIVDTLNIEAQKAYWKEIVPSWIHENDLENNEGVKRLMEAARPLAAFSCIRHHPEKLGVKTLYRLLSDIATISNVELGQYRLEGHYVTKAFKHISTSNELSLEEKAGLEYAYMEILSSKLSGRDKNSIPNLERYVELHPELYVQAVTWTYKRKDGNSDPNEVQVPKDKVDNLAKRGYHLLESLTIIPGHNNSGELETERLRKWVSVVRESCKELGRLEVGDINIGKLLSASASGKDGIWPCEEVRDILEDIQSEDIMKGMCTGIYNSRGVTTRSLNDGGNQERDLADKYRELGQKMLSSYPYVATKLLFSIAESYEYEAKRYDADASTRLRLGK